jgi:archaellum component FlaC
MSNDREHDDNGFNFDNFESDAFENGFEDSSFEEHDHNGHEEHGEHGDHFHENVHESDHEEHEGNGYEEHGEHGDHFHENVHEEHDDDKKRKKEKKKKSSSTGIKKFIKPVLGGVIVIGVLFVGYNYYKNTLSNSTNMTPNHIIAHNATPPRIPHNIVAKNDTGINTLPKINIPGPLLMNQKDGNVSAPLQQASSSDLEKPSMDNELSSSVNKPINTPNNMANIDEPVHHTKEDGDAINVQLTELIAVTKNLDTDLSGKFSQMTDKLSETSQAITSRLDKTDDNVSALTTHVNELDTKMNSFDKQLKDIQGGSLQHNTIETKNKKDIHVTKKHIEHKNRNIPHKTNLNGYIVRGVEKGETPQSAWIQTPSGYQVVHIGEHNIPGIGTVNAIHPKGDTWIVETSNGIISP